MRYLTKSRFKLGYDCPTKLFYTKKEKEYADNMLDNEFLQALAKGGIKVGDLAKCYFPDGHDIKTLDYEESVRQTEELLKLDDVIIYEAAFRFENLFIRADILKKKGSSIKLLEVKSKGCNSEDDFYNKKGMILSEWEPYLLDTAFQKHVLEKAHPGFVVTAYLMLIDKQVKCSTADLHQKFRIKTGENGRYEVIVKEELKTGVPILKQFEAEPAIALLKKKKYQIDEQFFSFEEYINFLADHYERDEKIAVPLSHECKKCQFKASQLQKLEGLRSGYKECWKEKAGFTDESFNQSHLYELWNLHYTKVNNFINQKRYFLQDLNAEDLLDSKGKAGKNFDRQYLQLSKVKSQDKSIYFDKTGFQTAIQNIRYPLHFIDLETNRTAIPAYAGVAPFEQIAFQFSHHIIYEDGTIAHHSQWIEKTPGQFPDFNFITKLKEALCQDNGSIFRYADHENSVLKDIYHKLRASQQPDREQLCAWIKTITQSNGEKDMEYWKGERNIIDMRKLILEYYYHPATRGSNSIKRVLPAILNACSFLQQKYSQPIYGSPTGIQSLNFKNQVWVKIGEKGKVKDPYKLLPPVFEAIDHETLDLLSDDEELNHGGAAMTFFNMIQYVNMGQQERDKIIEALLKYCELDTLAMVMIWEHWIAELKRN